jgi:Trp operon repressor
MLGRGTKGKENPKKGGRALTDKWIERQKTTEYLKCILTEEEKKGLADRMARAVSEIKDAEGTLKSASTQLKADIAKHTAELDQAAEQFRNGYVFRHIDCTVEKNYQNGSWSIFRMDTFEIIKERPLEAGERQRTLPLEEAPPQEPTPKFEEPPDPELESPETRASDRQKTIEEAIGVPCLDCLNDSDRGGTCDRSLFHVNEDDEYVCEKKRTLKDLPEDRSPFYSGKGRRKKRPNLHVAT